MKITKKILKKEINILQQAEKIHAKYSIKQYKSVLKALKKLEKEKLNLEEKVKERTIELEKLAKFDTLTHLPNRFMFKEELTLTYESALLLKSHFSLLFIDLDNFKDVNDIYGHEAGDILLQTISKRFLEVVRKENDVVSRLGGDEFTIILKGIQDKKQIEKIVRKIILVANEDVKISEKIKVNVSASVGIYIFENNSDSVEEIIANADIAMYKAKQSGKNRYVFYTNEMKQEVTNKLTLKQNLIDAFKNGEFCNYLQPIINSKTERIVGAEVLLRWKHNGELISPAYFFDTLESMDLMANVTYWQIENVIKEFQNIKNISLSFNLSEKILHSDKIIEFLKQFQNNNKIPQLSFEITEHYLMSNIRIARNIITQISNLGFNILLDDFGTGYSSLAYIREFPLNVLKIDKSFVDKIPISDKDYKLFKSIIEMAKILEMKVVIEGVETYEELQLINKADYIKIQGYYYYTKP